MLSPSHASCDARRQGDALTGVLIGQPLSRERTLIPGADAFYSAEGNMIDALSRASLSPAWSKTLACQQEVGSRKWVRFTCYRPELAKAALPYPRQPPPIAPLY